MGYAQRRAAIVGVYTTEQARFMDRTGISLQLEAIKGALDDAGLTPAAVDGLIPLDQAPHGRETSAHMFWAEQLGERPITFMDIGLASGIGVETLLAEIGRRQRLMKPISAVLTPDTVISRNPHLRSDSVRISAGQWALLIRVTHGSTPRNLARGLGRSVFCTVTDVYRLLVLRLLLAAGQVPEHSLAVMSFVRAASLKKGDTMPVINARTAAEDTL